MLARCMISAASAALAITACTFQSDSPSGGGPVGVQGQIVDFQSRAAVAASSVTISGLIPEPQVDLRGASFSIGDVPADSAFGVLAAAAMHRPTYSQVVVASSGLDALEVPVVGDAFITGLAGAFGVTLSATRGIVLLRLLDAAGAPRPGVAGIDLAITGASGPRFLDDKMMAAAAATASSSSGWVVFFDVPPGLTSVTQTSNASTTIEMPALPAAAGVVTIAEAKVTAGAPVLPSHVSFATQIVPIFSARGCQACHSGGGIGKEQGNLTLGGASNLVYKELVDERPDTRVRLGAPETSLVLTMPSREDPPDRHPNVTFTGPRDPDYLKLLVWIREGAKQN
jgi:hypothetical protein